MYVYVCMEKYAKLFLYIIFVRFHLLQTTDILVYNTLNFQIFPSVECGCLEKDQDLSP